MGELRMQGFSKSLIILAQTFLEFCRDQDRIESRWTEVNELYLIEVN